MDLISILITVLNARDLQNLKVSNRFFCICILLIANVLTINAQSEKVKFTHLTTRHGLSQSTVNCIIKDRNGFMWFGTEDGLNKYDGYKFTIYRKDKHPNSLASNNVLVIYEDRQGVIWVGTDDGLSRFDKDSGKFINYRAKPSEENALSTGSVTCIYEDKLNNLWIGTYWNLNLLDRKTGKFRRFLSEPTDDSSISHASIFAIHEDKEGQFWIGTGDGLNQFDRKTFKVKRYLHDDKNPNSISAGGVSAIQETADGQLLIGTKSSGLNVLDKSRTSFKRISSDTRNPTTLSSNSINAMAYVGGNKVWVGTTNALDYLDLNTGYVKHYYSNDDDQTTLINSSVTSIYLDLAGILWVGTYDGGINKYDRNLSYFDLYQYSATSSESLSKNIITSFAENFDGDIWVGTDGGGLNLFDKKHNKFKRFSPDPKNPNSLASFSIMSLYQKKDSPYLWVGYYGGGLDRFNTKTNTFNHYKEGAGKKNLNNNNVYAITEDSFGNTWIGTNGGGVNVLNNKTLEITKLKADPANVLSDISIQHDHIRCFFEDSQKNMWIGTVRGLSRYNPFTKKLTHYNIDNSNIGNHFISSIISDRKGRIWIGTKEGGLNLYNSKTNKFTVYGEAEGLPSSSINYVAEDKNGDLWLSTNNGVCQFNPETRTIKLYNLHHGLQSLEFKLSSGLIASNGEVYFGGANGFNLINPAEIARNVNIPKVVITDFQIANKTIIPGERDSILKLSIEDTRLITLPYDKGSITFEFSALDFTISEMNTYAYMLDGFETEWNEVGVHKKATYANLDPGKYRFRVKAANNDGVWSTKETSIDLIIVPPFWRTWWFRTLAFISLCGLVIAVYKFRVRLIEHQRNELDILVQERTEELQAQSEELQAQSEELTTQSEHLLHLNTELSIEKRAAELARCEAEKANKAKSIFLATMSHEIRTPMNGVIGMASLLTQTTLDEEQKEYVKIINTSGEALLGVINDVLDFSKIESGNMEIEIRDFSLRHCIEDVMDIFSGKDMQAGIDLIYQIDERLPAMIIGDSLRLRQILINLINNAMKFTHEGHVFLNVEREESSNGEFLIRFDVHDTGIGISEDKIAGLFNAFSQVDSSTTRKYGGTGLGLAISQRLIELMGGEIGVRSEEGVGTTFYFKIKSKAIESADEARFDLGFDPEGKRILIVDDNATSLTVLKSQLNSWKFDVVTASSAKEALEIISRDSNYRLVISDRQMPEMDGVELAKAIKKALPLMPIVLLGLVGDESKSSFPHLFNSVLSKPVKQQQLLDALQAELKEQSNLIPKVPIESVLSVGFALTYPLTILIAEDHPINQKLAIRILNKLGYEPELANNGEEAVAMVRQKPYDVVFMDMLMPEMDGLEATRVIRSSLIKQPKIIAMTANAMPEDREACLQAGMNDYISKPIKLNILMDVLKESAEQLVL